MNRLNRSITIRVPRSIKELVRMAAEQVGEYDESTYARKALLVRLRQEGFLEAEAKKPLSLMIRESKLKPPVR